MNVKIEKMSYQGKGIGYVDKKVVFVPKVVPGDNVDVTITSNQKKYYEGCVNKYISRSKDYKTSVCPFFEKCGGCAYQSVSYDYEARLKFEQVREVFKRGGINCNFDGIITADYLNYRNKIVLKVYNGKLGLYEEGSHNLVNINHCFLCNDRINDIIKKLENLSLENVYEIVIRIGVNDTLIIFKTIGNWNINLDAFSKFNVMINDKVIYGSNYITARLGNYLFRIKGESFYQVNDFLNESLYLKVGEYLSISKDDILLDLFCGAGTIGIFLANRVKEVIGVEINQDSIECANINKKINNISNISFICADVGDVIDKIKGVTHVIVDPPRSGLSKRVIKYLKIINPRVIVYTSCNYHTMVRDLKLLSDVYCVKALTCVDMFPRTYHVETVCVLERK